jgi:hypothetical protein
VRIEAEAEAFSMACILNLSIEVEVGRLGLKTVKLSSLGID